jgi:hypothetical protein
MMKRSVFLSVACGLLVSLACTTPSQAGGTLVTTIANFGSLYPPTTPTLTSVEFTYTGAGTISSLGSFQDGAVYYNGSTYTVVAPLPLMISGDTVTLSFASPVTWFSGSFTFLSSVPYADANSISVSANVPLANNTPTLSFANAVPEPPAMALLGIGMTSFLAFRRFFKRWSIA